MRKLLAALALLLTANTAHAQNWGAGFANIAGSQQFQPRGAVLAYGGILYDPVYGSYLVHNPAAAPVSHDTFDAWFAALGGTAVTDAKWMYNAEGVYIQSAPNTVAQPCYSNTRVLRGMCIETWASENKLLWSEDFTQAAWTKTGGTITANNYEAPTATMIASTFTEDTSNGVHEISQLVTAQNANLLTYTAGCFVSGRGLDTRTFVIRVDDNAGTPSGAQVIFPSESSGSFFTSTFGPAPFTLTTGGPQENGTWYEEAGVWGGSRLSFTFTKNTSTSVRVHFGMANQSGNTPYTGDGLNGMVIWGCELKNHIGGALIQSEVAPTSYVRTTTTAVNRAQDLVTIPMPVWMQNETAYSLFSQVYTQKNSASQSMFFALTGDRVVMTGRIDNGTPGIAGTTMTVTAITSGNVSVGQILESPTAALGTRVNSQVSGTPGGIGVYTVSVSQDVPSTTLEAIPQEFHINQSSATFSFAFGTRMSGSTGGAACGVNTALAIPPVRVFDQTMGVAAVVKGGAHYFENSSQGTGSSPNTCFFTTNTPVTRIRLGMADPTSTLTGGNTSVTLFMLIPGQMTVALMRSFLYASPPYNPDKIAGPNFLQQHMITDVRPLAPPLRISRGPSGCPVDDVTINATGPDFTPHTMCYTSNVTNTRASTSTTASRAILQWGNRCSIVWTSDWMGYIDNGAGIAGNRLTVTEMTSGTIAAGDFLYGLSNEVGGYNKLNDGTIVEPYGTNGTTGTGGVGTYSLLGGPQLIASAADPQVIRNGCIRAIGYPNTLSKPILDAGGARGGLLFTSVTRADAMTLAFSLYVNGFPAHKTDAPFLGTCPPGLTYCGYMDPGNAAGIPDANQYTYAFAEANTATVFPVQKQYCAGSATGSCNLYMIGTDVIVFPDGKFGDGLPGPTWGTFKDAEMVDSIAGRTATRLLALELQQARIHHHAGYKYGFGANPFLASGLNSSYCGDPTAPAMVTRANCDIGNLGPMSMEVDHIMIHVTNPWGRQFTSFEDQVQKLYRFFGAVPNVDFKPSALAYSVIMGTWPGGTTLANSDYVNQFTKDNNIGGIHGSRWDGPQCKWTVRKGARLLGIADPCP